MVKIFVKQILTFITHLNSDQRKLFQLSYQVFANLLASELLSCRVDIANGSYNTFDDGRTDSQGYVIEPWSITYARNRSKGAVGAGGGGAHDVAAAPAHRHQHQLLPRSLSTTPRAWLRTCCAK
ncbi:hypothetical protein EVAR_44927_1 [Eumeta japonica]|uniref:Uncharacterized protein n=1 Tax=Eumeta variegata TaxID=151549 RepID=A0A4C2ABH0_EUMVA|nr:hypothetical protein EVAR_44927_1 [Eumeta japonica]